MPFLLVTRLAEVSLALFLLPFFVGLPNLVLGTGDKLNIWHMRWKGNGKIDRLSALGVDRICDDDDDEKE